MKTRRTWLMLALPLVLLLLGAPVFAAGPTVTISWVGWSIAPEPDSPVAKVLEQKFGVKLDAWNTGQGAPKNVRIASGEVPDVFSAGGGDYREFAKDGIIMEMNEQFYKQRFPTIYLSYMKELPKEWLEIPKIDGKAYGLTIPDPEAGGTRQIIVYRGDWMKKVGVTAAPTTINEFETLMYKFTNDDPDGNGKKDTYGLSNWMMAAVYGAFGYHPDLWSYNDQKKVVCGAVMPEMKQALALLNKWYKDGVLDPEFVTGEHKAGHWSLSNSFIENRIGTTAGQMMNHFKPRTFEGDGAGEMWTELNKANPQALASLVYGAPPVGPNGKKGMPGRSSFQGAFLVLGSQLKDDPAKLEKACQIVDFAGGTWEGYMLSTYGIEGTHWKWDNANNINVAIGNFGMWSERCRIGAGGTFNMVIWLPSNIAKTNTIYRWAQTVKPDLYKDVLINALYIPTKSYPKYIAELDKVRREAYMAIIKGEKPLSFFDDMVKTWMNMGGVAIYKELGTPTK